VRSFDGVLRPLLLRRVPGGVAGKEQQARMRLVQVKLPLCFGRLPQLPYPPCYCLL
jgi:hypothetical protein